MVRISKHGQSNSSIGELCGLVWSILGRLDKAYWLLDNSLLEGKLMGRCLMGKYGMSSRC